jgi:hypothetical protein
VASLRVKLEGNPESIALPGFSAALQSAYRILIDLDSAISREPKGTLDWYVSDLGTGSLVFEIKSSSRMDDRNVGPEVAHAFIEGLHRIEYQGSSPPYLSDTGMRSARSLVKLIGHDGIAGMEVSYLTERVEVSAQASANIDQILPVRHRAAGSVEGRMEMISIHKMPRFTVYHSRTRKAITCKIDNSAEWLERVKAALGERVLVSGVVHSNARGEPMRVDAEEIRILRPSKDLPSLSRLYGSDPDFTGDMTTEEYLRSIRVG